MAALSSRLIWEVRTTGNSLNGAAFRAGASGTDYSQQNTAQVSYTDLVIGATNTNLTSAGNPFTSAHVGNVVKVASGTGFTPGYYEILTVSSGVAAMNAAVGTASSTGGVGKLGGAASTPDDIDGVMVTSNIAWIKAGTYTTTAGFVFSAGQSVTQYSTPPNRLIGYTSTRGDNGQATFQLSTNSSLTGLTLSNGGWVVENITVDCNSLSGSYGIVPLGNMSCIINCKVMNSASRGIQMQYGGLIKGCEVTGCVYPSQFAILNNSNTPTMIVDNYVHDSNASWAIGITGVGTTLNNVVASNTGVGIYCSNNGASSIYGNTVYNNGGDGIQIANRWWGLSVYGNLVVNNTGYGLNNSAGAGSSAGSWWDGNAFFGNTSGNRNNMDDTTVNPQNGVNPYVNVFDKILTANPFVNGAGGDFRLNSSAGGGANCRGTGLARSWLGLSVAGYPDMGAIQHQDSGGAPVAGYYAF